MEQELMDILTDLRPDVDFETETALIDDHILESFDIVSLVAARRFFCDYFYHSVSQRARSISRSASPTPSACNRKASTLP